MNLGFGLGHAVPEAVNTAWGARLIFPDDLLPDRQDLTGEGQDKADLIAWLNGQVRGQGAITAALKVARKAADAYKITSSSSHTVILYQDDKGVIVACPNASYGYLYVAGWLHHGEKARMPGADFQPLKFLTEKEKAAERKAAQVAYENSPIGKMVREVEERRKAHLAARKAARLRAKAAQ